METVETGFPTTPPDPRPPLLCLIHRSTCDTSACLYALHHDRKMPHLLQQDIHLSPTVEALWLRYAENETIGYQVAALDAHDFAAILCMIHTQYHNRRTFIHGRYWTTTTPWRHTLRHMFKLDTVMGIRPMATAARRVAAIW